jgi:hypothetical protein
MVFEWPSCSWATARMPIVKTRGVIPSSLPSRGRVLHLLAHQHMRTARTSSCIHEVCYKGGRWACLQRRRRSSGRSRYKRRPALLQAEACLGTSSCRPCYMGQPALLHGVCGALPWHHGLAATGSQRGYKSTSGLRPRYIYTATMRHRLLSQSSTKLLHR